ncbi:MAG: hypothetical protein A3B23_03495 [Candidatus Colwellbacteria bacterium RIFCSPLOWO2_01_FULL_48_10]|uniref:Nudix hydrolase domain-containing protein n=2 Tax=Bacteria candidate phyla TaxID=1783234 RepID=A0A1F5P3Z6_9BACT|nr:MAG: hypothetical protein A2846_04510 [Candidatus Doudnabacteria bacterium RIFCSPHIGHO2_01_FULL_49_9]OGY59252.1 MAG: hypothetical protein A3B23_03495 [Candidatus Colwellbacteria bacterium RIFCSPLOWO2_01_FULL_48_10]
MAEQVPAGQLDKRPKLQPNIGAFIGLVGGDAILLRQRTKGERASITGRDYTGQWELPGGAAEPIGDQKTDYYYVFREALRELNEEAGVIVEEDERLAVPGLPLFFNAETGPDLTIVYPLPDSLADHVGAEAIDSGAVRWVHFDKLQEMARNKEIVGGYGKRHHIMALHALATEAKDDLIREAAQDALNEINQLIFG